MLSTSDVLQEAQEDEAVLLLYGLYSWILDRTVNGVAHTQKLGTGKDYFTTYGAPSSFLLSIIKNCYTTEK